MHVCYIETVDLRFYIMIKYTCFDNEFSIASWQMATFYSFLGATVLQEILEEVKVKVRKLEEKYKKKMEEKGLVSFK